MAYENLTQLPTNTSGLAGRDEPGRYVLYDLITPLISSQSPAGDSDVDVINPKSSGLVNYRVSVSSFDSPTKRTYPLDGHVIWCSATCGGVGTVTVRVNSDPTQVDMIYTPPVNKANLTWSSTVDITIQAIVANI